MARGDKGTYNQQEQQAFNNSNAAAQQAAANQNATFDPALAGYESEYNNPGYTASEKQQMTQAESGSLAGAFNAAVARERDRAARTGNTAGMNATEEELGREQGQQQAQAMGSLQQAFGNARISGQQNALAGESGLYRDATAANSGAMNSSDSLVGTQGRLVDDENNTNGNFWGKVISGGLGAAGKIFGGK